MDFIDPWKNSRLYSLKESKNNAKTILNNMEPINSFNGFSQILSEMDLKVGLFGPGRRPAWPYALMTISSEASPIDIF